MTPYVRKGKAPMLRGRGDVGKPRQNTHWDGCEEIHHECALDRLETDRAELDFQQELVSEAGSAISLARRALERLADGRVATQDQREVDEALEALCDWEDRNDLGRPDPDGVPGK